MLAGEGSSKVTWEGTPIATQNTANIYDRGFLRKPLTFLTDNHFSKKLCYSCSMTTMTSFWRLYFTSFSSISRAGNPYWYWKEGSLYPKKAGLFEDNSSWGVNLSKNLYNINLTLCNC